MKLSVLRVSALKSYPFVPSIEKILKLSIAAMPMANIADCFRMTEVS